MRTVALFVGTDLTSHLIVNSAVPRIVSASTNVLILACRHSASRPTSPQLRRLHFLERDLINDTLYPATAKRPEAELGRYRSLSGLARKHSGVELVKDVDVNSSELADILTSHGVEIGFSIRCYQKFRPSTIDYFRRRAQITLLNLHPGLLPQYRGVFTYARALAAHEPFAGFTLHHIDARWDHGDIVGYWALPLEHDKSILANMIAHHQAGAYLILDAIDAIFSLGKMPRVTQDDEAATYFSHATTAELAELDRAGVRLADADSIIDIISALYCQPGSSFETEARALLSNAIGCAESASWM